jgi:hypothetical protein
MIGQWAAIAAMRRALHDGQKLRPLQEKAIGKLCPHCAQRGAGEATGEDSAFQVTAELALDVSWHLEPRRVIEVPERLG